MRSIMEESLETLGNILIEPLHWTTGRKMSATLTLCSFASQKNLVA